MSKMNNSENVKEQYSNDNNLSARMRLHLKHSTNKQGLVPWLFDQYEFHKGFRILELGCGNAAQWNGRIESLAADCLLVLTDLSDGMVDTVWQKYSKYSNVLVQRVDIQDIPFPNDAFDVIIANYMLYHIPDLDKALSEVKRVLKANGRFYTATNGNGGMRPFLRNAFKCINPKLDTFKTELPFAIQNGERILCKFFNDVKLIEYEDSLKITDTQDLLDWIKSTVTIASYSESDLDGLFEFFEEIRIKEGAINIPKEAGLFIASQPIEQQA